jgi:VanZ family protein
LKPHVLPDLRYRRLWLTIGVILVLVITVVCLLPGKALPKVGLSDKSEHLLAFGALAFWFGGIVVRRDLPWVGLAVVGFGGLIELAQGAMGLGREADWLDLAADTLGMVIGLALVLTPLGHWARWFEALVARTRARA